MYELIKITEKCYFMDAPTKVGFYKTSETDVVLIDSGSDKSAAKKVLQHINANGWTLKAVYITHSHADHIGGNEYIQNHTDCKIYANGVECACSNYPFLEPAFLYGGLPLKELDHKFIFAKPSKVLPLTEDCLPEGLKMISLPGHYFDMVGFITDDRVFFMADTVSSPETLGKYGISYVYDVEKQLQTLEFVKTVDVDFFLGAHTPLLTDIVPFADTNYEKTVEVADKIVSLLDKPICFEELLSKIYTSYNLTMHVVQGAIIGSAVKSYLSYLVMAGRVETKIENNFFLWYAK